MRRSRRCPAAVARDSSLALAYDHLVLGLHAVRPARAAARAALDLRRRAGGAGSAEDTDLVPFLELVYDERFVRGTLGAWARYLWLAWRKAPRTMEDIARLARIGTPWLDMPNTQLRYSDLLLMAEAPAADAHASAHEGKGLALFALGRDWRRHSPRSTRRPGCFDTPEARLQQAEWRVVSRRHGSARGADTVSWERRLADMAEDSSRRPGVPKWALALARLADGDTARRAALGGAPLGRRRRSAS